MNNIMRSLTGWFETSTVSNETNKKQGILTETRKRSRLNKTHTYFY